MHTMTKANELPGYVDPFPGLRGSDRVAVACGRCGGTGVYAGPTNVTFHNGRHADRWCFDCNGSGKDSILVSSARAAARRVIRDRIAREEAAAAFMRRRAELDALGGPKRDELTKAEIALRAGDPLKRRAAELLDSFEGGELRIEGFGEWDAAVDELLAAIATREAAKRAVPTGRLVIEGVVLSKKSQESAYGTSWKMLVEGDGWKVWGTVPESIFWEVEKGVRVRFTATVEASEDDEAFGFYKRPTKAEIVG